MKNIKFNPSEIFNIAVRIEEKGMKYYTVQAEQFSDKEELKKLFLRLKSEEKDHYNKFKELSAKYKKEVSADEYDYLNEPEVSRYLHSLVEFSVFPEDIEEENQKGDDEKIDTINDVLLIAIMAEKESILFYQEILNYNQGETAEVLENLIEEEKSHLIDLTEISQKYQ